MKYSSRDERLGTWLLFMAGWKEIDASLTADDKDAHTLAEFDET
jgi:hypothetical protein